MNKPLFCLSPDNEHIEFAGSPVCRYKLGHFYADAVKSAGGIPFIACAGSPREYAGMSDALLLTGGGDVDPGYYGEEKLLDTIVPDPVRDSYEEELFKAFKEAGKPIFCICRGFQFANVLLGGSLYQDLEIQRGVKHYDVDMRHGIVNETGTFLYDLFGERVSVNSTHHQAVKDLGKGLRLAAVSEDGVIEAFCGENYPIFGTQFHPERLTGKYNDERCPDFLPLFEFYVNIAKK